MSTITIIESLKRECQYLDALIDALKAERETLATNNFEQLEVLATLKETLTKQLEASAKSRMDAMNITSAQTQEADIARFIATLDNESAKTIKTLNAELAERLSFCHDLNNVNGQVITTNIHNRAELIGSLTGKDIVNAISTYSATGAVDHSNQTQHYEKA